MNRIPVLATIRDGYRFAVTNLGAIIALIWLPMVVVTVTGFFAMQRYYAGLSEAAAANSPALAGPAMLLLLVQLLGAVLLYAMMYMAVTQLALGARTPTALPIQFGRAEWRMARALLTLASLAMGLFILAGLALGVVHNAGGAVPTAADLGAVVLLYGAIFFVLLRLLFFAPVVAAAEDGPVLARAWQLSKGNFWRILAVVIGVLGPLVVLVFAIDLVLVGPVALGQDTAANEALVMQRMREILPMLEGLVFFISPLLLGLPLGAAVSAWRGLTRTQARTEILA
jgi:hypothetical protein